MKESGIFQSPSSAVYKFKILVFEMFSAYFVAKSLFW